MRQDRSRIVLTVPELLVVLGFVVYGVGALAFALFGPMFFAWVVVIAVMASPFALYLTRRHKRRLARVRAARRRARLSRQAEPSLDWEKAA